MLRKLYLTLLLFGLYIVVHAQSGALKGTIKDRVSGEPIPFANVILDLNGSQVGSAQSDFDGNFTIKPITPGKYNLKAVLLGYAPVEIVGIIIGGDKTTFYDVKMSSSAVELKEAEKIEYKVPLISKDNTTSGATISREDIANAPTRDVTAIAATTAGVTQADNGRAANIRGTRSESTVYYIDGVKVRGSSRVPQGGVEQVDVITGGVPASYGDVDGGIISITTRGPSKIHTGGVEFVTSQFLDPYGYNLLSGSVSGPLYTKRGETQPVVGYFTAADVVYNKDNNPLAGGSYKVKEDKLKSLKENPLLVSPGGGAIRNAESVTLADLEKIKTNENNSIFDINLNAKIEYKPSTNTSLSFGGTYEFSKSSLYNRNLMLFANDHYGEDLRNTFRSYVRFTQKFGTSTDKEEKKSASTIKNAYYSVQLDYSLNTRIIQDPIHKDNLFNYGYIGKFKTTKGKTYGVLPTRKTLDTLDVVDLNKDVSITFEPGGINPESENYTKQVFAANSFQRGEDVQLKQGFLNGDNNGGTSNLYVNSLFLNTGSIFDTYGKANSQQFRVVASGSADVKDHALVFGLEYEQRIDRSFQIGSPARLWTQMRGLTNRHINGVDFSNTTYRDSLDPVTGEKLFTLAEHDRLYSENDQSEFDKNFRQSLGKDVKSKEFLDIDNYDPSAFKLSYFSANELLQAGLVNYSGYSYYGESVDAKQDFNKFFTDTLKRPIGAFQPNYIAGYIQDKFTFRDIILRVGIRVDRFDANQKVLKDKYLMYEAFTAGEVEGSHPSNIGDDYVVYVDGPGSKKVIGYRDGDTWYDASGTKVLPTTLAQGTTNVYPYLKDPEGAAKKVVNSDKVFKDYEPEINVMPRLAFSFPISDEALFFAHYDVLTQRPNEGFAQIEPYSYLQLAGGSPPGGINNPDLKPQKTTDWELGFKQKINNSSAISITGYYKEIRGLISLRYVINAYPTTYQTYDNRDFTTVKGLGVSYDLRRTNNVAVRASYNLQFATGTGSNANSAANLTIEDPEIRTPLALDFDRRHQISISVDYRYGKGEDYNGPIWFGKKVLEEAGLNVLFSALSGTPYTQRVSAVRTATFGEAKSAAVKGELNAARLPWNTRIDAKLDKNFEIKWTKKDGDKKSIYLNVYLLVQNLLDTRNVLGVYQYTGSPSDDGYLASEKNFLTPSFKDLYSIKVSNPFNYTNPRFIRLGAIVNF